MCDRKSEVQRKNSHEKTCAKRPANTTIQMTTRQAKKNKLEEANHIMSTASDSSAASNMKTKPPPIPDRPKINFAQLPPSKMTSADQKAKALHMRRLRGV